MTVAEGSKYSELLDGFTWTRVYVGGSGQSRRAHDAPVGYGAFGGEGSSLNGSGSVDGSQTQPRAILTAALSVLKKADKEKMRRIIVSTTLQYVVDAFERDVKTWIRNGWRLGGKRGSLGGPVKSQDLIKPIYELVQKLEVKFEKANTKDKGMMEADKRANEERDKLDNESKDPAWNSATVVHLGAITSSGSKKAAFGIYCRDYPLELSKKVEGTQYQAELEAINCVLEQVRDGIQLPTVEPLQEWPVDRLIIRSKCDEALYGIYHTPEWISNGWKDKDYEDINSEIYELYLEIRKKTTPVENKGNKGKHNFRFDCVNNEEDGDKRAKKLAEAELNGVKKDPDSTEASSSTSSSTENNPLGNSSSTSTGNSQDTNIKKELEEILKEFVI